jgi:hypothetical protein
MIIVFLKILNMATSPFKEKVMDFIAMVPMGWQTVG